MVKQEWTEKLPEPKSKPRGSTDVENFGRPEDLSRSLGREAGPRAGQRHWEEKNIRVTRAMLAGNVRLGQENLGQSAARSVFFSARFARCYNISPPEIRCLSLNVGTYDEKLRFKTGMKHFFQNRQVIF